MAILILVVVLGFRKKVVKNNVVLFETKFTKKFKP